MRDEALDRPIASPLVRLRLPTKDSLAAYALIKIVLALLLAVGHEECEVSWTTGKFNQAGDAP
jgi:hypothetical protein